MRSPGQLKSSSSELDLDGPNIEDYLPSGSSIQEPLGKLRLRDLLDISPTLTEAAGAIVDVFVANHTSMIDFIILEQMTAFAVIMQKHPGWVGLLQSTILESVGCIWFNRSEAKDREIVARKLRDHVQGTDNNPLLIFPEGTCVNNHYTVMFKKGAFELGCTVCPVAIKYNKIFVDAFWNSRKQSFTMHLLQLMTSWAVVCDVWYLEPQTLRPGETAIEFAERVRDIISVRAGLKKVPWDGYLKYSRPSPKHRERKQQSFAESVLRRLDEK
ncbi:glycerol-3-phosphate acyltransferase 9 [Citrus sinensis]|uniref:Glycerol-3-phosphate acyltransferase 9 n=1 Tax=Citrus sinensis TaxID=2711 RepID=A0ACB8IBN6_CITSI|nr:glycerol-3-phosphate acyltransferase 9 [Citrus sinensis]